MKSDRESQRLARAGLKAIRERSTFSADLASELRRDRSRRERVATRFKERLFAQALKSAGIDRKEIRGRQLLEDRSREKYLARLAPRVNANVRTVARSHAQQARLIASAYKKTKWPPSRLSGPPFPPQGPPASPIDVTFIDVASFTQIRVDQGSGTVLTQGHMNNTLSTELLLPQANNPHPSVGCDFVFDYAPIRSGVLRAAAYVATNGSLTWNNWSTCWGSTNLDVKVMASISVQQFGPGGVLNQVPSPYGPFSTAWLASSSHDHGQDDHCMGDIGIDVYDRFEVIPLSLDFPALGLAIAQVVVSLDLTTWVDNAGGDVDFATGGRNINVLGVAVQLF
jgi:hypothetical protein